MRFRGRELSKNEEKKKDSGSKEKQRRLKEKPKPRKMQDSEENWKSRHKKRRRLPFKPLSPQLWHSNKRINKQNWNECKPNKNKLELKMKERERSKKLLEELSEKRRRDSFKRREMKREPHTKQNSHRRKKQQQEPLKLRLTGQLLKQWKSKDWHMKKKKEEPQPRL